MFASGIQYNHTITMITVVCCNCGIAFGMPSDLQSKLVNDPDKWFFCPNGHTQHYSESKEVRLRREAEDKLRIKERQLADADTAKRLLENSLKKVERKLKRVHNGTCPCCQRSFQNLMEHMKTKHPEMIDKLKVDPIHKAINKKAKTLKA